MKVMLNLSKIERTAFLFSILALPFAVSSSQHQTTRLQNSILQVAIVWNRHASAEDSVDQESYASLVESMGFEASKIDGEDLDHSSLDEQTLLLIPHASSGSLSNEQVGHITGVLKRGLRLVLGGESPLLSVLGIKFGERQRVGVVIDVRFPSNHLHWTDRPAVKWIDAPSDDRGQVLYTDSSTGHPLVLSAYHGEGKYIVLAPHLDPLSGKGYSRFPSLVTAIVRDLGCKPRFRRRSVHAYFDPGYRLNVPIEELVSLWREGGISAVHVSAWYYNGAVPYDYKKLIDAAHKNGILVYAWLEWPHVGQGFWDQHPEWRQKNALLGDAKLDWLNLMDLQNPDCMNAALSDLSRQMKMDWAGVDIAELTITGAGAEALAGPSRPDYFTSFGAPMRREFKTAEGFDPLELEDSSSAHFWKRDSIGLDKFYQYRKVVNNRLLRRVVEFLVDLERKGKRDWEIIHTIVDNTLHPEFDFLLGFDFKATLGLVKEYGLTLNVEDPYMEWAQPPERYRRLRETLVSLIPERTSMIDINVVPIHPETQHGFASEQAAGAEFLQQIQRASEHQGRVCVYSESSVFEQDWPLVPHAMAIGSSIRKSADGWEVSVPATVSMDWQMSGLTPLIDGKPWPCHGDDNVILPPGRHRLTFAARNGSEISDQQSLHLLDIGGELSECRRTGRGLDLVYASPSRCLLTFDTPPKSFVLDGSSTVLPMVRTNSGAVVIAPSGRHTLSIEPR